MKSVMRKRSSTVNVILALSTVWLLSACASVPISPSNTLPKMNRGYTQDVFRVSEIAEQAYRESRWTEAAQHYQKLTEQVPNDAYVWFRLANTYVQKGEFGKAIHAYEQSIERDSLQPKPWFNLSTTYMMSAKTALLQSWENLRPNDPAREIIMRRIEAIDTMMNQEMGEIRVAR